MPCNQHINLVVEQDTLLEGGSTVLWPLWLHARQPGTLSLNSIIYYESDSTSVGLKYRTVRMTESIQVRVHIENCIFVLHGVMGGLHLCLRLCAP